MSFLKFGEADPMVAVLVQLLEEFADFVEVMQVGHQRGELAKVNEAILDRDERIET